MICCDCDVEVRGGGKSENTERNICQKSFCRNFVFVEFPVSLGKSCFLVFVSGEIEYLSSVSQNKWKWLKKHVIHIYNQNKTNEIFTHNSSKTDKNHQMM